jgi:hypothetical protein
VIVKKFMQREILLGATFQHQQHAVHGQVGRGNTDIELRTRQRMRASANGNQLSFVNGPRDQLPRRDPLSLR